MSSLYPEMRLSWEIKSVDALFCNGMTRVGDLSREAILSSIREDQDLSILKDDINKNLFNDKKFCKECISACVIDTQRMDFIEELIDFLIGASEETRRNIDAVIKEAITCSVQTESEKLVIGILNNTHNNKKIKTLTDTNELIEHAVYAAAVEENSVILQTILKWNQTHKTKRLTTKSGRPAGPPRPGAGGIAGALGAAAAQGGIMPKLNSAAMLYAAKKNDYERVKLLFRYGYRLERIEKITDPLKRIELFKAITSPAYIIATLENVHDVSSEFFCPVKKCFEFACEASAKSKAMPEYKREYQEIEHRCENYAITLLEQCENLVEVETFLETKTHDGTQHKNANYMMAILDSRKKFVAHERFQYVLLKKFGETDMPAQEDYGARSPFLWIDMPWYLRAVHVLKQIPCYFLLLLYPFFSTCCPWTQKTRPPWFVKQWRTPLNRCLYTAFSYMMFLVFIIIYVAEVQPPAIYWIDCLTAVWILSYTFRDIGTAHFLWRLENPKPFSERRFFKRYLTFWNLYNLFADFFFLVGLLLKLLEILMVEEAYSTIQMANERAFHLAAGKRILWGAAFSLAILKTIKVGIASKYFGPILLSMTMMLKDVLLFLITFTIIMLAFASGVSYIFNLASERNGTGLATSGVFQYFFWVLLQPFRGNPEYQDVADLPYNSSCLASIKSRHTNMKKLTSCIVETMYNTSCIMEKLNGSSTVNLSKKHVTSCLMDKDIGFGYLKSAAVPMWAIYQFFISVVLLRILIVMMTITYRRIYDDLDKQWKYARAYTGIVFFDPDCLLPPPFTFLSMLVLLVQFVADRHRRRQQDRGLPVGSGDDPTGQKSNGKMMDNTCLMDKGGGPGGGGGGHANGGGGGGGWGSGGQESESYPSLIFRLLDAAKPKSEGGKPKKKKGPGTSGGDNTEASK